MSTYTIKTVYQGDLRRFTLTIDKEAFATLKQIVSDAYGLDKDAFSVSYHDDEDDNCIIGGNEELTEAIRFAGKQTVKLFVTPKPSPTPKPVPKPVEAAKQAVPVPAAVPAAVPTPSLEVKDKPQPAVVPSVQFVADVTVPDDSVCVAGEVVNKVWSVKNTGAEAWPASAQLSFIKGSMLPVPKPGHGSILPFSIALPAAKPGETVQIAVAMTVPSKPGKHNGEFHLVVPSEDGKSNEAKPFNGDYRLWLSIVVRSAVAAEFVKDVTIEDGSVQLCNATIKKVWRIKNQGTAQWPEGSQLVWVAPKADQPASSVFAPLDALTSESKDGKEAPVRFFPIPRAMPGETVDIAVNLVVPSSSGRHRAEFQLCHAGGVRFDHDYRLWADVTVQPPKLTKQEFLAQLPGFLQDEEIRNEVSALLEAAGAETVHRFIQCDGCGVSPIKGIRYKCTSCPDFDLCEACEAKQTHPSDHVLLKCKQPLPRPPHCRRVVSVDASAAPSRCPAMQRSRSLNACEGLGLNAGAQAGAAAKPAEAAPAADAGDAKAAAAAPAAAAASPARPSWRNAFGAFLGKNHVQSKEAAALAAVNKEAAFKADYVADVTIPDGSPQHTLSVITKTWAVKNSGTSAWPEGTNLLFVGGTLTPVDGDKAANLVKLAQPGETVNVSVQVKIPEKEGRYTGYYRLATADGKRFGSRVWVDVLALTPPEKPAVAPVPASAPVAVPAPAPAVVVPQPHPAAVPARPAVAQPAAAAPKLEAKTSEPIVPAKFANHKFAAELAKLKGMGFKDDEMLLDLLVAAGGKQQQVIDWLVNPVA